jgi:HEPN domain-containing protein
MVYQKCNPNFQSQYCYLDNQVIHINDYLNKREEYTEKKVYCNKGHELVAVNPETRKKHFRHKNSSDMEGHPMSAWHAEWQGRFPQTEIIFSRKENQVRERRADVLLNETSIVEFQHSPMEAEEVFSRKNDYSLHGKDIIWVVDGNDIDVKYLEQSNRYFLDFSKSERWKYRSFDLYNYIFIDINEKIFKVFPKLVKNGMTDVSEPKSKEQFISSLFNGASLWDDSVPPQCELYVKQEGAGNGKTYGIIQRIVDPAFAHYKTFIYVTKQHSAKYIMFDELRKQLTAKEFQNYEVSDKTDKNHTKQYIYEITNKETGDLKHIVFATIDSFMHSVGEKNNSAYDMFLGIINNIIDDDPEKSLLKINSHSSIRFANDSRQLNKHTIFIVDECQDLAKDYARAIIKIMRTTYMDCLVVGDILQSIHHENNAFRFFMEGPNDDEIAPYIKRTILEKKNICRRFNKNELVDFVNKMVKFNHNDMGLPSVKAAEPIEDPQTSITFFPAYTRNIDEESLADEDEEDKSRLQRTDKDIEAIMSRFQEEVYTNKRKPNEFLFITPFTSNNLLAQELELQIHLFWEKEFGVSSNFKRYAVFHRSQEGTSINLDESKDATRIVSCHASKGDGREVVFLFGFTEKTIATFSKRTDSLIFESMVNVMFTRMKQTLYIQYNPNGDVLHRRYYEYTTSIENRVKDVIPVLPSINKFTRLNKLIEYYDPEENWNFFRPIVEKIQNVASDSETKERKIIDMTHHNIRKQIMDMMFMMSIVKREKNMTNDIRKKQFLRIFESIAKADTCIYNDYSKYIRKVEDLKRTKGDSKRIFPILSLKAFTRDGVPYSEIIKKTMVGIISYIGKFLTNKVDRSLCPLECIVLYFMNETMREGRFADITIFYLYDILDKYENGFKNSDLHNECCCTSFFHQSQSTENTSDLFHIKHFESLLTVQNNIEVIYKTNPRIAWLNKHNLYFDGGDKDFYLLKQIAFHGYDDDKKEVLLCYLKPQYNEMNEKEAMIHIIMDTWLLINFKKTNENMQKYSGKKIKACIISLDKEAPKYLDVEEIVRENESFILQEVFDRWISQFFQSHEAVYYYYKYYRELAKKEKRPIHFFCRDFSKRLKEYYDDNEKEAEYVRDFFLGLSIENDMIPISIKEAILTDYDDKERFIKSLNRKVNKDIAAYLQVELEDNGEYLV